MKGDLSWWGGPIQNQIEVERNPHVVISEIERQIFPVVVDGSASARYKSEIELNFRLAYRLLETRLLHVAKSQILNHQAFCAVVAHEPLINKSQKWFPQLKPPGAQFREQ